MQDGKTLLAAGIVFGLTSLSAQAALTTETVNGQNLVYDSGNNTTWTQDANLLGTWEGAYQSTSYNNTVTAIINASGGVIHDTPNTYDNGAYTLTAADFGSGGVVDWWAGQAFVHYLDSLNYGGSSQWALPTTSETVPGYDRNSQLGELFYSELGGTAGNSMPSGPFSNISGALYWFGTETPSPDEAWVFFTNFGGQATYPKDLVPNGALVWAVSPGNVAASAVPVPSSVWLFGSALAGFIGFNRRRQMKG